MVALPSRQKPMSVIPSSFAKSTAKLDGAETASPGIETTKVLLSILSSSLVDTLRPGSDNRETILPMARPS